MGTIKDRNGMDLTEAEDIKERWQEYPVVDVTGDRRKDQCCKEQHFMGTWNVRSMNQGKLGVVK